MTAKQRAKREQTHPVHLHAVEKFKKKKSVNTQNDYKTTSKEWRDKKKQTCSVGFVKVFVFQDNKFKIVQKNFLEIIKDSLENPLVMIIITW